MLSLSCRRRVSVTPLPSTRSTIRRSYAPGMLRTTTTRLGHAICSDSRCNTLVSGHARCFSTTTTPASIGSSLAGGTAQPADTTALNKPAAIATQEAAVIAPAPPIPELNPVVPQSSVDAAAAAESISQTQHPSGSEFHFPPTFGVSHEQFAGGHVPGSMFHINFIQDCIDALHAHLGLPWWGAIVVCTTVFRMIFLQWNISLIRNSTRLAIIRNDVEKLGHELGDLERAHSHALRQSQEAATSSQPSVPTPVTATVSHEAIIPLAVSAPNAAMMSSSPSSNSIVLQTNDAAIEEAKVAAAAKIDQLFKVHKCHPLLNVISPIIMAPAFLSVFLAVERLCLHEASMTTGGILWFTNLAAVDPTFVLPVLSGLTWIITIEMGADAPRTAAMQQVRSVIRFLAAVMVPVTAALPQGVFVYWITSNLFSIVQILLLRHGRVRKLLRIPLLEHHRQQVQLL